MPVGPETAARLAQAVVAVHERVELLLLERVRRAVLRGVLDDSLVGQLNAARELTSSSRLLVARLGEEAEAQADDVVREAAALGAAEARAELPAALREAFDVDPERLPGGRAVAVLVEDLVGALRSTHAPILRGVDDVYRQVVGSVAPGALGGAETRRQGAQAVLDQFARRGVSGFTDRAGRRWELASYAEMATRAGTMNAAVAGHMDTLEQVGLDLVVVSDAPQECVKCRPFEGKVLDRSVGGRRTVSMESVTSGRPVRVQVLGSLAEARRDGLFHPGCRHSVSAYLPGATRLPTATADPDGDAARQRLRALERRVRAAKRQEAVALDPAAAQKAKARVRQAQSDIREHVATTTAKRQPQREAIGRAR